MSIKCPRQSRWVLVLGKCGFLPKRSREGIKKLFLLQILKIRERERKKKRLLEVDEGCCLVNTLMIRHLHRRERADFDARD